MTRYESLTGLLDERYSCRQFLPKQVSRDVLEQLLAAAQRTPSWSNTQSWITLRFAEAEVVFLVNGVSEGADIQSAAKDLTQKTSLGAATDVAAALAIYSPCVWVLKSAARQRLSPVGP